MTHDDFVHFMATLGCIYLGQLATGVYRWVCRFWRK